MPIWHTKIAIFNSATLIFSLIAQSLTCACKNARRRRRRRRAADRRTPPRPAASRMERAPATRGSSAPGAARSGAARRSGKHAGPSRSRKPTAVASAGGSTPQKSSTAGPAEKSRLRCPGAGRGGRGGRASGRRRTQAGSGTGGLPSPSCSPTSAGEKALRGLMMRSSRLKLWFAPGVHLQHASNSPARKTLDPSKGSSPWTRLNLSWDKRGLAR